MKTKPLTFFPPFSFHFPYSILSHCKGLITYTVGWFTKESSFLDLEGRGFWEQPQKGSAPLLRVTTKELLSVWLLRTF